MKANQIEKKSISLSKIYEDMKIASNDCRYKLFYIHDIYVADEIKLTLIKDGYKVYEGEWYYGVKGLIIEW